jgi:antitoxin (DNA-binding transcriptional repressor) of toxin-antitoxin stability system
METITIHKAKTQLSQLIEKACRGEEIIIARGKRPVVKLVALPSALTGDRVPGAWKGRISYAADTFDSLTDGEMIDLGFDEIR